VKQAHGSLSNAQVSSMLGDMWRSTSNEEKSPYQKHERAEREIYKQRIALWREQKAAKEKVNPGRFYNQDQKTLLCSENFTKNRDHSLDHWSSRSNIVPSEKSFWKSGTRCDEKFIIEERLRLTDCDDYHTQQQMKISSASENPHGTKTHSFTKYSEFFSSERRHHFKSDVDATNLDQEPEIDFNQHHRESSCQPYQQDCFPDTFAGAVRNSRPLEKCHANLSQDVADPSYFGQMGLPNHDFLNEHHQNPGSSHINHSDVVHEVAYYPQTYQPMQTYASLEQANYMTEQHQRSGHVWTEQHQNDANYSFPHTEHSWSKARRR